MTNKNKSYHYSKIGKAKFRLFLRLLAMDLTATEAASGHRGGIRRVALSATARRS